MLGLFQSKKQKQMVKLLQKNNFYRETIENCDLQELVNYIKLHDAFDVFAQAVKSVKLGHFTLAKSILILLSLIQVDKTLQNHKELSSFLAYLNKKAAKLAEVPSKNDYKVLRALSPKNLIGKFDTTFNGKGSTGNKLEKNKNQKCDGYLVHYLLQPLLSLIERIIACYDQVYRPKSEMTDELCWATLNFLHKIAELNKPFEEIGRYYNEQLGEVVYETVRVLDLDIRILYKRMVKFIKANISSLEEEILQKKIERLTEEQKQQISQLVMFVGQIDKLNDDLRVIYLGKYFARRFVRRGLRNVPLFRGAQYIENLDTILENDKRYSLKKIKSAKNILKIEVDTTIGTSKSIRENRCNELCVPFSYDRNLANHSIF